MSLHERQLRSTLPSYRVLSARKMMNIDFSGNKTLSGGKLNRKLYQQAQASGCLDLSNRNLEHVPVLVWNLNSPLPPEDANSSASTFEHDEPKWWETNPITRVLLTSNRITSLSADGLLRLNTLTHLDVRDNQLDQLPDTIGSLLQLRSLIVSVNKIRELPANIGQLHSLVILDVSSNQLTSLNSSLSTLESLERLDASNNQLNAIPDQFPTQLRELNLSKNKLERLPSSLLQRSPCLRTLDLTNNLLTTLEFDQRQPNERASTVRLTTLHVSFNRLREMPNVAGFAELKELYLSDNRMETVTWDRIDQCSLLILDLARNRLKELPAGLAQQCPDLVRLDVSSNELSSLPNELGIMPRLQALLVERNPLRTIRQAVISNGSEAVKALLCQRYKPDESAPANTGHSVGDNPTAPVSDGLDGFVASPLPTASASGVLNWNGSTDRDAVIPPLPPLDSESDWTKTVSAIHRGAPPVIKAILLDNCKLTSFPTGLFAFASNLTRLSLQCNRLSVLPDNIDQLLHLHSLDLSRNTLTALPPSIANLAELTSLTLDNNPLGPEFPSDIVLTGALASCLESLSLSYCKLTRVPLPELMHPSRMPRLNCLNLADNDIDQLPAELGLCTQLRTLQLSGNTFRVPRPNVVAKGAAAVLEHLRNKLAPQ